jgi:hypothetical protein
MAEWVYIENNEIKEYHSDIPKNWRHVSGLDLSKDDLPFLKSLGWFPVTKNYQTYDSTTTQVNGYEYTIDGDNVYESYILGENQNQPNFEILKYNFLLILRAERNRRLVDSDWSQLSDVQENFDDETKNKWKIYRQKLRDIPALYLNNEVISMTDILWPEL